MRCESEILCRPFLSLRDCRVLEAILAEAVEMRKMHGLEEFIPVIENLRSIVQEQIYRTERNLS